MANIIENVKKVKRVLHRFDTAENWKKSSIKLLPGELAFDDNGNFKVGLNERPQGTLWNDLPYAGKSKFVSGTTTERPTISKNDSYTQGDMFKDITTNKWYFLTGLDAYGEYIWEELTFGSHDIESSIDTLNKALENKVDASVFEEELLKKADVSYIDNKISSLVTEDELLAVAELTDEHDEKIESLEETVLDVLTQLKEIPDGKVLEDMSNSLMEYTNEEINAVNNKLAEKATKDELQRALAALEEKHDLDLSTLDVSVDERLSLKADKEEITSLEEKLNSSIAQKVDISTIFDESGNIRSSLLPGSVDDIVEGVLIGDTTFMPLEGSQVGVGGKLYLDVNTKILYRWSGSQYVSISSGNSGLVLGTTAGTAYEGSSGKALESRVTNLEERTSELSSNITAQSERISSTEVNLAKQSDALSALTTNVGDISSTVGKHIESIAALNAKTNTYDSKIADLQGDIKEHTTTLANVNKQLSLIEAKNADQDTSIRNLSNEVTKVNAFDVRLNTVEKSVTECKNSISTLNITTSALTEQLSKLSNVDDKVDGFGVELNSIKNAVSEHSNKFVEQNSKFTVLENSISSQSGLIDALNSSISGLTSSLSEQDKKIDYLEDEILSQKTSVDALKDSVDSQKTLLDSTTQLAQGFSDRILTLENSDSKQNERLSGIESTVVTQLQDISSLKTSVNGHTGWISSLQEKVDNLLKLDTPDGTLTLGKLAFQDKVQNKDIEGVSITKLMQGEDEELELWCGDSNF
jgi:uncharacterized coiled-coil protein SlyX